MAFDSLSEKLQNVFKNLRSKGRLTEDDVKAALKEVKMVVEGITATEVAYDVAKKMNIDMPITSAIYSVLYEGKNANEVVVNLMMRSKKHEIEEVVNDKLGF